ncbi:hypothetical protein FACS189491_01640 [Spirochaetia bacterium]|nr:hypothetical protein FACS189491_01640 [Spirochaetia bacterium]
MHLNLQNSDKSWIISHSLDLIRDVDEIMDRNHISSVLCGIDELNFIYKADEFFGFFDREPEVFKQFLEEPAKNPPSEYKSDPDTFQMYYDDFLSLIFYLWLWYQSGKKIRNFQRIQDIDKTLEHAYELIGQCNDLALPECIISFIRLRIIELFEEENRGRINLNNPCLLLLSQIAIAVEPDYLENTPLIEKLKVSFETSYHYYLIIADRQNIPMERFLSEVLPLEYYYYAVGDFPEPRLAKLVPDILASHLAWNFPRRFREIECLKYIGRPEHKFLCQLVESTDSRNIQAKVSIFTDLFKWMQSEPDSQILELYTLLVFYNACYQAGDFISQNQEWLPAVTARVNKFLALLRTPDRIEIPPLEYDLSILCAYQAALFLKKHYPLGKAIKPLILALRSSKEPYTDSTLKIKRWHGPEMESNLAVIPARIVVDFRLTDDEEPVKRLRQDMANWLIDMLKPLPKGKLNENRRNHFSSKEQFREGFDISLTEPEPNQRYYILHAIADLGVSTDGTGHYFFAVLEKVSQNDPSAKVRDMAAKVIDRLKSLRGGWAPGSHERRVLLALWWFRLAHALSVSVLNEEDIEKAMASRSSEYHDILAMEESEQNGAY